MFWILITSYPNNQNTRSLDHYLPSPDKTLNLYLPHAADCQDLINTYTWPILEKNYLNWPIIHQQQHYNYLEFSCKMFELSIGVQGPEYYNDLKKLT